MGEARIGARRRAWLWWAVVVVGALLAVAAFWGSRLASGRLVGDVGAEPWPAPDFALTDQFGQSVRLADLRGRPVALTFVYTNCPDVCPMIAANVHAAYLRLGAEAGRVALVAVTVDPERDTVEQVRRFSDERGLTHEWLFLTGARPQLEAVWAAYGIYARPVDARGIPATPTADEASPELVEHSAPVFLVDKRGRVRALLSTDFAADDLVTDLRALLAEP